MASQLQTTAEIIPFPLDRRIRATSEKVSNSAAISAAETDTTAQVVTATEFGAAWYHDRAMADANLSRN